MTTRAKKRLVAIGVGVLLLVGVIALRLPSLGAALILHPFHKRVAAPTPPGCERVTFKGQGVDLQGWRGAASGTRRGTVIYLHGVADNRVGGAGVMERFRRRGFDVVAYDSRAHGESGGDACTYGFYEKQDLRLVMDTVKPGPIVLIGGSLGAAVALQLAATDRRISAVVAAEAFSDLRTVVTERTPSFFTSDMLERALKCAEQEGKFAIEAVSPATSARDIVAPVLLIHGAADSDTPPDHSRRIFAALPGPKRLILVPGAHHNESLHGGIWGDIERWLDTILKASGGGHSAAVPAAP